MRVLLADDSDYILERLQETVSLCRQAVLVGSYRNGPDTLKALKILKPDLAIVDNKMPGLNGLDILKEIRKEDKTVKIIILTFYASDSYKQQAFQSGADYFFSKVDDFDKIQQVISEMVLMEVNSN